MKLLKSLDVAKKLNISKDHFRKTIKHQPEFPKPVKLTPKAHPMWRDVELIDHGCKADQALKDIS